MDNGNYMRSTRMSFSPANHSIPKTKGAGSVLNNVSPAEHLRQGSLKKKILLQNFATSHSFVLLQSKESRMSLSLSTLENESESCRILNKCSSQTLNEPSDFPSYQPCSLKNLNNNLNSSFKNTTGRKNNTGSNLANGNDTIMETEFQTNNQFVQSVKENFSDKISHHTLETHLSLSSPQTELKFDGISLLQNDSSEISCPDKTTPSVGQNSVVTNDPLNAILLKSN